VRIKMLGIQVKELLKILALIIFLTFISAVVAAEISESLIPAIVAAITSFISTVTPIVEKYKSGIIASAVALIMGIWGIFGTVSYAFNLPFAAHYYQVAGWGATTGVIILPFIIGLISNLVSQEASMAENMGEGFIAGAVLLTLSWLFAPDTVGSMLSTFGDAFMKTIGLQFGAITGYITPIFGLMFVFILQGIMAILGAAVAEWISPS